MKLEKKGFWYEASKQSIPIEQYLKKIEVDGGFFATDFLHGFCNMLALRLHEKYGYGMCICISKEKEDPVMIHTYCVYNGWYIDARGCTNDKELFFQDFGGTDSLDIDIAVPAPNIDTCSFYEKLTYEISDKLIKMSKGYSYPATTKKLPEISIKEENNDFLELIHTEDSYVLFQENDYEKEPIFPIEER